IALFLIVIITPLLVLHMSRILYFGVPYYPVERSDPLNNPYMGWAPSAEGGPYHQPHSLVYINTTWRELEPVKGAYDFDLFEDKYQLKYWESKGVHIILRLNMDFPSEENHMDIPDWLYEEINGDGMWYDLDYGKGFSPNYSNSKLISYHKDLIKSLSDRYNKNDLIPIIALGSIGHWGEWHTKQDANYPIPFPPVEISNQYVEHYLRFFQNKYLVMRRPFEIARENKMGLYNDSFGHMEQTYDYFLDYSKNGYYDYLANINQPAMPDYWKYAPSGGEVANPPGIGCFDNENINDLLDQIKKCHTSWLGPSCPAYQPMDTELQHNFDSALNTMGYRFVLDYVKHAPRIQAGKPLSIKMVWENKGSAPFYYPWPLELSLADLNGNIVFQTVVSEDIRNWLPGKHEVTASIDIPSLEKGRYQLCAAIVDPNNKKPSINLSINHKRSDGRYALDYIFVTK
ncbi:MAG: DUF4832 domain-containing protein, partial [Eubacteriales bacterium]|nr:DUF4832 domain-containing protein [Eubacteriales bacterium]